MTWTFCPPFTFLEIAVGKLQKGFRCTVLQSRILGCLASGQCQTLQRSCPTVGETWPGESPEPWLVSPWVLDWAQPAELPAGGAEVAGVASELRNGGNDKEREQAVPSTSSSCSPSCLLVVRFSHGCQMARRHLLNCQNLSLLGPEGANMAILGPVVTISAQAGANCPALSYVVIAWGRAWRDHHLPQLRLRGMAFRGRGHGPCPDHRGSWLIFPHAVALLVQRPEVDYQKEVTNLALLSSGSCGFWGIPSPESEY